MSRRLSSGQPRNSPQPQVQLLTDAELGCVRGGAYQPQDNKGAKKGGAIDAAFQIAQNT